MTKTGRSLTLKICGLSLLYLRNLDIEVLDLLMTNLNNH